MTEDFRLRYKGEDVKEHCEKGCMIQAPFAGRLKWIGIRDPRSVRVDENNESAWKAVLGYCYGSKRYIYIFSVVLFFFIP